MLAFIFSLAGTLRDFVLSFGAVFGRDWTTAAAGVNIAVWVLIFFLFAKIILLALCLINTVVKIVKSILK